MEQAAAAEAFDMLDVSQRGKVSQHVRTLCHKPTEECTHCQIGFVAAQVYRAGAASWMCTSAASSPSMCAPAVSVPCATLAVPQSQLK